MIRTDAITIPMDGEVPDTWVFEHYLGIEIRNNTMIKSVFNPSDTNPSMCFYNGRDGKVRFHDFSTGISGTATYLVMKMYSLTQEEARNKIISDYYGSAKQVKRVTIDNSYKVTGVNLRLWDDRDIAYWGKYSLNKNMLEYYNIRPLLSFEMSNGVKSFVNDRNLSYGYFDCNDDVYKIYQPGNKEHKFLKIKKYVQGIDQLQYKSSTLIICSSLKDLMCARICVPEFEYIAPDSENTILPDDVVEDMFKKYKHIYTLFDNDHGGEMGMAKYKIRFGIPYIKFNVEKDIADCVKAHGRETTREMLMNLYEIYINR